MIFSALLGAFFCFCRNFAALVAIPVYRNSCRQTMATIRKRGPYQYQAEVRRKGYPRQVRTFETKADAQAWSTMIESEMVRGVFTDRTEAEQTSLKEALERYLKEVTPSKRGADREASLIRRWQKHPLAYRSLASLRPLDFVQYRDERLRVVAANTVRIELALISHLFTIGVREWGLPISNPIQSIRKPRPAAGRDRRLACDEEERLLAAAEKSHAAPWLGACIKLAIQTGMRAGEILSVAWQQVDLERGIIWLSQTKNGDPRTVPLTLAAVEVLRQLPRGKSGRLIEASAWSCNLSHNFHRACNTAGIEDLRFHDLRHEAASRFAPRMTPQTLAKVMGWRSLQMAMRYYNPTGEELVRAVRVESPLHRSSGLSAPT
jgi:integrase